MGCSPPGSSVHGIFQAWILEWVAISFSNSKGKRALIELNSPEIQAVSVWGKSNNILILVSQE